MLYLSHTFKRESTSNLYKYEVSQLETYGQVILALSGIITIGTVLGFLWKIFKWIDKNQDIQKKNTEDIKQLRKEIIEFREDTHREVKAEVEEIHKEIRMIKDESVILVEGLSACLDGIHQMGANHCVTDAKQKLDEYINVVAHR